MNNSRTPMHNDLEANKSKGFVTQQTIIQVGSILSPDTKFNEKIYDNQNFLLNNNKLCGCFSLKSGRSNNIYMHFFFNDTGETNMMSKFRYLKFLETFTKGNLSVDIRA